MSKVPPQRFLVNIKIVLIQHQNFWLTPKLFPFKIQDIGISVAQSSIQVKPI